MTFDISLEAIEADLTLADRDPGGRLSNLALAKAQIRATLLAASPDFKFPMAPTVDQAWGVHPSEEEQADAAADVAGIIIDGPTDPEDEDDDFFAEARRERD